MDDALVFAPGWHRKWLLLLAALFALFLSRYRLMGALVSTLVTRQLAKKVPQLQLDVQVRLVLLRPLQLVHVEVVRGSDWTLLFTRITVHSRMKEFFRSFGQTKIWVLEIDDIVGELRHLDDDLLRELVRPAVRKPAAPASSFAHSTADATNPVGFLRFVDCRVASIRLTLRCFEAVSELRCRALAIGITDVLVDEDLLFVKLQAANVFAHSYRAAFSSCSAHSRSEDDNAIIRDGVLLECPSLCLIADLKLQNQSLVGAKLHGVQDEPVALQLSTSFVEWVMLKKLELIRRGLLPVPTARASTAANFAKPTQRAVLVKEVTNTSVTVVIVHDLDDHVTIPLKLTADVVSAATAKLELSPSALIDFADDSDAAPSLAGVCHRALVRNISVAIGREFKRVILGTSSVEVRATQTEQARGNIECSIGELEMFLSPRVSAILQSLTSWSNRIKSVALASERALADAVSDYEALSSVLEHLAVGSSRPSPIEWDVVARLESWRAKAVIQAKHELAEELVVKGEKTILTTTVVQSAASRAAMSYAFEVETIRADAITSFAHAKQRHRAVFTGATITVTKDRRQEDASTFNVDAKFQSVAVNGANGMTDADTQAQTPQFPAAVMTDVHVMRHDRRTKTSVDSELSISIADSRMQWNHRTHAVFLREWSAIVAMIDKVDAMVSLHTAMPGASAAPLSTSTPVNQPTAKTFALDVRAKSTEVLLYDVRDVASFVTLRLMESKAVHQKQLLTVQSSFECLSLNLFWGSARPAIDIIGVKFAHKVLLGPQRLLAKVPVQSSIRASQMKVFMRPAQRLLLLLMRFDELVNAKYESDGARDLSERKATRQGVSFECALLTLEIHEARDTGRACADTGNSCHGICHMMMDALEIKSVIAKSFEISESMGRLVQAMRQQQQQQSDAFSVPMCVQPTDQVLGAEGSVSAKSLTALRVGKTFASFQQLELQFAITNIARAVGGLRFDKTTIFDVSGLAQGCEVTVEKGLRESISKLLLTVEETFDTRELEASGSEFNSKSEATHWRLRYMGNIDFGLQHCVVVAPYGDGASPVVDTSFVGLGERLLRISIRDFALNFRQFQKLVVQLANFRVHLDSPGAPAATSEVDSSLQLIAIPQLALDCMVHWKERQLDAEQLSGDSGREMGETRTNEQLFAVSFELNLKSKAGSAATTHVPMHDEALIALNWDIVYPLLVHFLTDDDDTDDDGGDVIATHTSTDEKARRSRLQCIGVQWDVSVDMAQVAFWDAMTKDVGLLLVLNDFLSHGFAKCCLSPAPAAPVTSLPLDADTGSSAWAIHEATTYMDLCRAYVLRNSRHSDDFGVASVAESDVIPFNTAKVSNFFFETIGTSYRAIRPSSSTGASTSVRDDDDGVAHDPDATESLFSDWVGPFHERLHDGFKPIEFQFSLFGSTRLCKAHSILAVSPSNQSTAPLPLGAGSMPTSTASTLPMQKPPRPWIQTVRAKLMRLKRRSSSMDNLLLDDGSCPIQIDSMKLLWTIETRDTVFYMTSLVVDSMQWLTEAKKSQQQQQRQRRRTHTSESQSNATSISGSAAPAPKIHSWRPAAAATLSPQASVSSSMAAPVRRGSTRDTLLELLQQGKLGAKQVSCSPDLDGPQRSSSETRAPSSLGDGGDVHAARVIALKQYTLDIHDAQINIREENSQSSVLAASKHIHLEVGLDDTRSHTVAHLKFTSVTAHVAPIDVDISAGVGWYAQSPLLPTTPSPRAQTTSSSCLLQQVMDECSLSMTYSHALATGATAVEVDLSFLHLSADRHQFYQLLNVMRHVLLAPPTHVRKQRRQLTPHVRANAADTAADHDANELLVFPASPSVSVQSLSNKKTHAQLLDELRSREAKQLNARTSVIALKCISFRVEGTRFRLRTSPEVTGTDHEFVEIRAEGIAGSHTYFSNQCTKLMLNLQWMEVTNLRPGPSSIAFDDAMAVLKAKLLLDKRYQSSSKVNLANQKGMLTIRAESGPLIRVLGQKLRVLDVLEVSVFPEISNMIVIQLAADFYDLVYKFFFEPIAATDHHHHELNSEQVLFGRKAAAGQVSPSVRAGRAATASGGTPSLPAGTSPQPTRRKSTQLSSNTANAVAAAAVAGLVLDPSASYVSVNATSSSSCASSAESAALEDDDASTDGCELFYFKYVRVGNVRVRINCNGFFVNLSDFDLDLPPYVCQSKLCTWKKLLQKFESHLKWFVTKESASSGLSHFKNKFLKWPSSGLSLAASSAVSSAASGAASGSVSSAAAVLLSGSSGSDKKDKTRRDEDSSANNAQVLFGPYSGAAT